MNINKQDIINGLFNLGLKSGDEIEVHSSLSSLGYVSILHFIPDKQDNRHSFFRR